MCSSQEGSGRFQTGSRAVPGKVPVGFAGSSKGGSGRFEKFLSGGLKSRVNSPTVGSCTVPRKVPVGFRQVPVQFPARFLWVFLAARRVVRDGLKSSFQEDLNQELILPQ